MRTKGIHLLIGVALISVIAAGVAVSQQGTATSSKSGQDRPKKLKERAMERDVEVEGVDGSHHLTYVTLENIKKSASAIVYGRIINTHSYWEDSGAPIEQGEDITTEYSVEVLRVMRDTTRDTTSHPVKSTPAQLVTPLRIARNGGVVDVNGHRASVKVKGYESLKPGKQYVFFLFWSSDYKAYVLGHGIYSVIMVNDDSSLQPLASLEKIQSELRGMTLEDLINQVSFWESSYREFRHAATKSGTEDIAESIIPGSNPMRSFV